MCPEECRYSFCSPFSLTKFLAAATSLSSSTANAQSCQSTSLAVALIFSYTSSIFPGFCNPFLPSGRHLLLFPSIRWESFSTRLLPFGLSLSPPTFQSFLNASFYCVYSSFWSLIPFSLPARSVFALGGLLSIKFFIFLSPFRMGLTNPSRTLRRFLLLSTSPKLLTLSGTPSFFTN